MSTYKIVRMTLAGLLAFSSQVGLAMPENDSKAKARLTADPKGAEAMRMGYFPVRVNLSERRPDGVRKEPKYRSKPKYGVVHLGNGPASAYVIALDEPANADWNIYIDVNHNGDLTDDGDGTWSKKTVNDKTGRVMYGVNSYVLRASYGTDKTERSSAMYGLNFYRFGDLAQLLMYRNGVRTGSVRVGGKTHEIALIENDGDALYDKPIDDSGKATRGKESLPVWLVVDPVKPATSISAGAEAMDPGRSTNIDDWDGLVVRTHAAKPAKPKVAVAARPAVPLRRPATIDARAPFELDGNVYEAKIAADGSTLELMPTTRVAFKPKEPERPALLAKGAKAPDFVSDAWGGGKLTLADFKGKVVILDFWATWCGPCQRSMPHIEKVHRAVKDKGVVVLGLCVWDDRKAYDSWVPENSSKYTFKFAFDLAARDNAKSVASNLYKVSGIPTTYVIDKDGNVVDAIVGYQDGDTRVEEALKKAGVAVE